MNIDRVLQALREGFPEETLQPETLPVDETVIPLPAPCIHPAVELLVTRFDVRHLSTITAEDAGDTIALLYHFWDGRGLTLSTRLPPSDPHIATITDLVPGAAFYEREVTEMLGVIFDGHPGPSVLLLPDDWDDGPPLRKQREPPAVTGPDEAKEVVL